MASWARIGRAPREWVGGWESMIGTHAFLEKERGRAAGHEGSSRSRRKDLKADGDSSQAQPLLAILETDFTIKVPSGEVTWKQEGEEEADMGLPGTQYAHGHAHDTWQIAAPIRLLTYLPATSYQAPRSLLTP